MMTDVYQSNLAFLQQHHPRLYESLQPYLNTPPAAVETGYDLLRLAQWPNPGVVDGAFLDSLKQDFSHLDYSATAQSSPYHLLVLGLGTQLGSVVEEFHPRHLILYEFQAERLTASLHQDDWSVWKDNLTVLFDPERKATAHDLLQAMVSRNLLTTDGAMVASLHDSIRAQSLAQDLSITSVSLVNHWMTSDYHLRNMRNSLLNSHSPKVRLWRPHKPRPDAPPVMVVGSGPSAEKLMDEIRRLAPSCLVVAAGTAAHVLLSGGVVPDLAVILGSNHGYYNEYRVCVERWPIMRRVPLLASGAADPRCQDFAETLILFNQDSGVLPLDCPSPGMTAPTVTNAAFAVMVEMGFTDFLFFGIDMGARDVRHRYASTHPRIDPQALPDPDGYSPDMPMRARGNFGGQVWTNSTFTVGRQSFESYLPLHPQLQVRNCADGALIRGAQPAMAKKIILPPLSDKDAFVRALITEFPLNTPQPMPLLWPKEQLQEQLSTLRRTLQTILAEPPSHIYDLADALWLNVRHRHMVPLRLMQGSLLSMIYGTVARLNRLSDDDQARLLPEITKRLEQAIMAFCDRIETALDDMAAGQDGDWLIWDEA